MVVIHKYLLRLSLYKELYILELEIYYNFFWYVTVYILLAKENMIYQWRINI